MPSIPAIILPPTPLVRTVMPLTAPRTFTISCPGMVGVVTTRMGCWVIIGFLCLLVLGLVRVFKFSDS